MEDREMSRQERREAAKLNRNVLMSVFAKAFGRGGLKAAQNELLELRRECPQHGSQYEMAFRETLRIAKKGANPVMV